MTNLIPEDLKYTESHEWVREDSEGVVFIGITDHAQEALGDLVFLELAEVGTRVKAGESCGTLESVKAASDLYSPVSGEVLEKNQAAIDEPASINSAPYDTWLLRVRLDQPGLEGLLSAASYADHAGSD